MNFKLNQFWLSMMIFTFLIMCSAFMIFKIYCTKTVMLVEWEAINIMGKNFDLIILLDLFSLSFFFTVMVITTSVLIFSNSYMNSDTYFTRFHLLIYSFVFSMIMLIFSPNLVSALIGWDGLGMSSYLLVIYYASEKSFKAGMITALTNRVGDALLIIYIGLSFYLSTLSASLISSMALKPAVSLALVFLVAVSTKSAQIPFSAWLPAAMAAPTPVSALVHSSTLVTAGIYLMFRFSCIYSENLSINYLLWAGVMTMFLASLSALTEMDMKKMVALSTLSQLGVMSLALGSGLPMLGFLHLLAHAFFKALLFLSTGSMIHACGSYQDMRKSGSVMEVMPVSSSVMLVCLLSLMGAPFMVSFYSKETIIESMVLMNLSSLPWSLMIMGVLLTGIYSMRMLYTITLSLSNQATLHTKSDNDLLTNLSMMVLLVPGTCSGVMLNFMFFKATSLSISTIQVKVMIYIMLLTSFMSLFLMKLLSFNKAKMTQWVWTNLWNLPLFSGMGPLSLLKFYGMKLNFLNDYSWMYSIKTKNILSSSEYLVKTSMMFNSNKFSRFISICLLFITLIMFM
uniref:NADH-ubiquinone oxidoreductase chain 5 n=1 Tax=Sinergasilus polycolpus TaxID=232557 RepID=C1ING0_SINPO|nr:NADH dehydrogenase subunit 5 [Sinergasilus polycolpus]ACB99589.1 NADH dehydrogenase subunit 5 [Sinergasilus polycolpus]ALG63352.1 NADH dehydrogenase subunit 5 [Sinergasilus polycolpus]